MRTTRRMSSETLSAIYENSGYSHCKRLVEYVRETVLSCQCSAFDKIVNSRITKYSQHSFGKRKRGWKGLLTIRQRPLGRVREMKIFLTERGGERINKKKKKKYRKSPTFKKTDTN